MSNRIKQTLDKNNRKNWLKFLLHRCTHRVPTAKAIRQLPILKTKCPWYVEQDQFVLLHGKHTLRFKHYNALESYANDNNIEL